MTLVDTSAIVEFLRGSTGPADRALTTLLREEHDVAATEPVVMEVLAGARDADHLRRLKRFLRRFDLLAVNGLDDYEAAAEIWAACRRRGLTVRSLTDCLIARVALRERVALLHADRDFGAIASVTGLQLAT